MSEPDSPLVSLNVLEETEAGGIASFVLLSTTHRGVLSSYTAMWIISIYMAMAACEKYCVMHLFVRYFSLTCIPETEYYVEKGGFLVPLFNFGH